MNLQVTPLGEADRIRERYARCRRTYEPWEPWVQRTHQELDARLLTVLHQAGMLPPSGRRLLDVGCGSGGHLLGFLRLGFEPRQLAGTELIAERAQAARRSLPAAVSVFEGDASQLALPAASYDVVFQSLVFSSILDESMRTALAERMWHWVAPGGGVLWYDFTWNNPANADVRGVPLAAVRKLFPTGVVTARRVTLAPPLSRFVTRLHPSLYGFFNLIPLLRTHLLCWIAKPR